MKNIKNVCKNTASLNLFLGIIGSIYLAYRFGVTLQGTYYTYLERDWLSTILIFVLGVGASLAFSIPLFALAEIIDKEDTLLSKIENNIPSLSASPESTLDAQPDSSPKKQDNTFWIVVAAVFFGVAFLLALAQGGYI